MKSGVYNRAEEKIAFVTALYCVSRKRPEVVLYNASEVEI